jgi:uncharacterized protein DUF3306
MTEPKNFVARWSRLKREAERERKAERTDSAPPSAAAETTAAGAHEATTARPETDAPASRSFDPASLPPIDSITARTDIRSFLQSGVPAELTRAVLRRAWRSDPAIRDFIGIAENQWDFTDPAAIPGFGPLRETDHLPSIVAQALGRLDKSLEASAEMGVSAQERPSATTCPGHGTVDDSVEQTRGMLAASPGNAGISASAEEKGNPDAVGKNDGAAAGNDSRRHQRGHASALPR